MKTTIFLSIIIILASCSTVKPTQEFNKLITKGKTDLKTITMELELISNLADFKGSLDAVLKCSPFDSLNLALYGPFGFEVAKLYSNKTNFFALNMLQNEAYKGIPSRENFVKALKFNLSFEQLIAISLSDVPGQLEDFIFEKTMEDKSLFKNNKKEYLEYILIDNAGRLTQYQQKDSKGNLILNIFFNEYFEVDGYSFAKKITIKYDNNESELQIVNKSVVLNDNYEMLSFEIPKSIKTIDLTPN